nr:MAG TPA: Protein of unknown function (DUF1372) [Caudoviricetes sp.]DAY02056.1 MAG TPA: Protein of unknown function (DUF1372) [Caudoviricetes sp.]DAY40379.1 MAG TPA: Protein of unknown function (DUF1372) [Caudoviricetes sp.]
MTEIKLIFFIASCVVSFYAGAHSNRPVVVQKGQNYGRYYVVVRHYGRYLVNEEQYKGLKIGDDMPEFLKKRGN